MHYLWTLLALLAAFVAGYFACKLFGPVIDAEAGVIIHGGEAYYQTGLRITRDEFKKIAEEIKRRL